MEVSAKLVDATPAANLRVDRAAFGAVWAVAERAASSAESDYVAGVALTCRWLAGAVARSSITGFMEVPWSPILGRQVGAMPETIAEEYTAAVVRAARVTRPERAEYVRGVIATLDWIWNGSRRPPLDGDPEATG